MILRDLRVRPIQPAEASRFHQLLQTHHYLGALPKIGETLWYVATWQTEWVALLSFSAAAWKCAARDRWIGWPYRHQYDRLHLLANNSRFLILPTWHRPNLASRTLALCQRRLSTDWQERFGHPLLLLETFVDPTRFHGTLYKASNWRYVGATKGFRRTQHGYSPQTHSPKMVFVYPLHPDAQALLAQPILATSYRHGGPTIMLTADQMRVLPACFTTITDPRRAQGRRHPLPTVLALAAGATLCGMRGYKAMADWVQSLGPKARARFGCRLVNGRRVVPSEYVIRDLLIRIAPDQLDRALQRWQATHGESDESLAIDGKTMCNAINPKGQQTHIMSVVGHQTKGCHTQKKSGPCP
jgi:hypothetical protein